MSPEKIAFVVLNVAGGIAVLASYALWLGHPSNDGGALWGSLGGPARALYTASMLAATAGYFAFASFLLRVEAKDAPFVWINLLMALILFPSALWMPLSFEYLAGPSAAFEIAIRATLLLVGVSSALLAVLVARVGAPVAGHGLALAGALAFTFQTLALDAVVWPRSFFSS